MNLTPEQQDILDQVVSTESLTSVSAVAGSGKTSLLVAIANALNAENALYLAYNKAIAVESAHKFPDTVTCSTTHSLAYRSTVKPYKLTVGFFSHRDVKVSVTYEDKVAIVDTLRDFCLSPHTSIDDYTLSTAVSPVIAKHVKEYLSQMQSGSISCTHDFYLKMFHILLDNGSLVFDTFDLLMLDEAGDLNPVTLEIFKLLPATRKLMVGDEHQNIYIFNGTINGFEEVGDDCTHMRMTQSFRVSAPIAEQIQTFCRRELDPEMVFKGIPIEDKSIHSSAFISRTNGALISEMIDLNNTKTPYNLIRTAKQIFQLPLILIGLKPQGFVANPQFKFLQEETNTYAASRALKTTYPTLYSYLLKTHSEDITLRSAISLIMF